MVQAASGSGSSPLDLLLKTPGTLERGGQYHAKSTRLTCAWRSATIAWIGAAAVESGKLRGGGLDSAPITRPRRKPRGRGGGPCEPTIEAALKLGHALGPGQSLE